MEPIIEGARPSRGISRCEQAGRERGGQAAWHKQPDSAEWTNSPIYVRIIVTAKKVNGIVRRMKAMHPTEFENLTYDLLFLSGIRNLNWRTPGSDGGRDLEGDYPVIDFAGDHVNQKWYVECKRYAKSINWPTVHEKLAVAQNHQADFLLFVTTANFSPQCRNEVDRHNRKGGSVQIRIWPFFKIDQLLSVHGQLAVKYGLKSAPHALTTDFRTIVIEITKLAQSTYAASTFEQPTTVRAELLASFSELLAARFQDVNAHGKFVVTKFRPERDSFEWCKPFPLPAATFDQTTLRAALSTIRAVAKIDELDCAVSGSNVIVQSIANAKDVQSSQLFALVETFGMINATISENKITLTAR
jgi:hypothetical protein